MIRSIATSIAALTVAIAATFGFEVLGHLMFAGAPDAISKGEAPALPQHMWTFIGWSVATTLGVFVAARYGAGDKLPGYLVAGVMLIGVGATLRSGTLPMWVSVSGLVAVVLGYAFGVALGRGADQRREGAPLD